MSSFALGANYTFFSHSQRGAAVSNAGADTLTAGTTTSLSARITPNIQLQVTPYLGGPAGTQGTSFQIPAPVQLYGPGDVSGMDTRHVIRTEPLNLTANFEPNYFSAIEFDDPGLPWLFTPAIPTNAPHQYIAASGGVSSANDMRLRPWVVLIVLADGEFTPGTDPLHPSVTNVSASVLPDLGDSWAWAHVQVVGDMNGDTLDDVLANEPWRTCSRIICPRNLEPETHYTAFLVPAFDAGCQAALGTAPTPPAATVAPAWLPGDTNKTLPYFYSFQFGTSDAGDFETLVRRLQPRALSGVGSRPMATDIPNTYWGTPAATTATPELALGGALTIPDSQVAPFNMLGDISTGFMSALGALISNVPTASSDSSQPDPMIVPPLYGRWQAGVATVAAGAGWLNELNLDPRWRVAAGLGATVVINERDKLVAAAWDQIGPVQQANQLLRQAQLARGALGQSFSRVFESRSDPALLSLTSPVHTRVLVAASTSNGEASATTIAAQLSGTYLPPTLLTPQARRLLRARGPIARTTTISIGAKPSPVTVTTLTAKINQNALPFTAYARFVAAQPPGWPGPTFSPLILSPFRSALKTTLAPSATIAKAVLSRIPTRPPDWEPKDPIEPIMAAPVIDSPMCLPLAALDERYFLPGVENIPPDTVAALETNRPFIEAYMVGLNFEMARQLLWRRYPTDQRGTYFRQFWPAEGYVPPPPAPAPTQEQLYDISPIDQWALSAESGNNQNRESIIPDDAVVLLVRGELLHRYPNTIITAQKACFAKPDSQTKHIPAVNGPRLTPLFRGSLSPDITYLGFALTPDEARGDAEHPGWFFVFQNHPSEPRFGFDELSPSAPLLQPGGFASIATGIAAATAPAAAAAPGAPAQMKMIAGVSGVGSVMRGRMITLDFLSPADAPPPPWGQNAAAMAGLLFREPVRVFMHAELLLACLPIRPIISRGGVSPVVVAKAKRTNSGGGRA